MRYKYLDSEQNGSGMVVLRRISWDIEGSWPALDGYFPSEHPSRRFCHEFAALQRRGYALIFSTVDGHSCAVHCFENQSRETLLRDLDECLGWERIEAPA